MGLGVLLNLSKELSVNFIGDTYSPAGSLFSPLMLIIEPIFNCVFSLCLPRRIIHQRVHLHLFTLTLHPHVAARPKSSLASSVRLK